LNNLLQRFGYGSVEKIRAEGEAKGKAEGEAKGKAEGEAKGKAEGEAKGKAEGRAEALVRVLQARGLAPTAEQRQRILGCADAAALDRWIDRAVSCSSIEDMFG
jgi:membrane protein involved in colicin uptake